MTGRRLRRRRLAHHPRRRLLRGPGYWRRLGPGIVTGAADDDPSGIGTYSQVGAAFGFGLLWTALATPPLAIAVQETTARLGLVTGKGLAALIRQHFARVSQARAFYAVIAASILVGVTMGFVGVSPIRALYLAAILNGVAAPPLLLLLLLLARSRAVLGAYRSGMVSQLLVGGAAVVMAVLSLLAVLP